MRRSSRLRLLDIGVACAYAAAVLVAVAHHEPWADEAQSWLISRDVPFRKMLFSEMHYEGSPALWNLLLWIAQHVFHAPYAALGYFGAALAIAGAAVFVWTAPFPRVARYLMLSSYYVLYQYAVIARPYVMLLLFGSMAAIFYRQRRPISLSVALALLALVCLQGAIIAAGIGICTATIAEKQWREFSPETRREYLMAAVIILGALAWTALICFPAPDAVAIDPRMMTHRVEKILVVQSLSGSMLGPWPLAVLFYLIFGLFLAWRNLRPLYIFTVGGLFLFHNFGYGAPHHEGILTLAVVLCLWISWPEREESKRGWQTILTSCALCLVLFVQTTWTWTAWHNDFSKPYSGAADMAAYIRGQNIPVGTIAGTGYGMVALQAYWNGEHMANWPTSYMHHSVAFDEAVQQIDSAHAPEYVLIWYGLAEKMQAPDWKGYHTIHVSPGTLFFCKGYWRDQTYYLLRRDR